MKSLIKSIILICSSASIFAQNSVTITPQGAGAITYGNTNQVGDKIILADNGGTNKTKIGINITDFYFHVPSSGHSFTFGVSGGIERMRIKGDGKIGINTSSPNHLLHIGTNFSSIPGASLRVEGPASSGGKIASFGGYGDFEIDKPGIIGGRFVVKDNGNVGIGTASPNARLQLSNEVVNRKIVLYEDVDNDQQFNGFGIGFGFMRYQVGAGADHAFFTAVDATSSSELFRIKGNGNVGIGTSNPAVTLDIKRNATGAAHLRLTGVNESYMEFYPDNALPTTRWGYLGYSQPAVDDFIINNQRNGNIVFNNNAGTRLILSNNGNIITDASSLNNGTVSSDAIQFGGPSGSGEGIASKRTAGGNQFGLDFYTNSQNRLAITNTGKVGIGNPNPTYTLSIYEASNSSAIFQNSVTGTSNTDGLFVGYNGAGAFVWNYENTDLFFGNANTSRMKLNTAGNLEFIGSSKIVNEAFINVTFNIPLFGIAWQNNGGGAATAQYYKDKEGRVHLKGMISGGTTSFGTIIFTLPAGYRPMGSELLTFPVLIANNGTMGSIRIEGSGAVSVLNVSAGSFISLDGISFRAE